MLIIIQFLFIIKQKTYLGRDRCLWLPGVNTRPGRPLQQFEGGVQMLKPKTTRLTNSFTTLLAGLKVQTTDLL